MTVRAPSETATIVTLTASLAVHGLFVAAALHFLGPTDQNRPEVSNHWSADAVEVGTVTPEPAPVEPAAPEPAEAPPEPTPEKPRPEPPSPSVPELPRPPEPADLPEAPAPRPARAPSPPPESASAAPSSEPLPARVPALGAAPDAGQSGTLGMLGLPPGVRHLGRAFTKALSATWGDPRWSTLPLGVVGRARVTLSVDPEGRLSPIELDPEIPTPSVIEKMLKNAMLNLRAGRFSIDPATLTPGVEHYDITVELSLRGVTPDETADPQKLYQVGHQPPEPGRPGFGRFTLNSGRHVEAQVSARAAH